MILSLDSLICLALVASSASLFLLNVENLDFSLVEVVGQKFADEVALALQKQPELVEEICNGEEINLELGETYCIEVKCESKVIGKCTDGQRVTRGFFAFNGDKLLQATVLVYLP